METNFTGGLNVHAYATAIFYTYANQKKTPKEIEKVAGIKYETVHTQISRLRAKYICTLNEKRDEIIPYIYAYGNSENIFLQVDIHILIGILFSKTDTQICSEYGIQRYDLKKQKKILKQCFNVMKKSDLIYSFILFLVNQGVVKLKQGKS